METKGKVLYIGGFELPDKNAAAQRVIGVAKGFRELQYEVVFLNSVKGINSRENVEKEYFGFQVYEYGREAEKDYLVSAKTTLEHIDKIKPDMVIAYNYPGIALERIRKYLKKHNIKCIADATEWYQVKTGSISYRLVKTLDTSYRMRIVQKKLDGVIAISRFLYEYYRDSVKTVMIPPTVDITDEKWNVDVERDDSALSFIYAGSPSAQKERLDLIVDAIEKLAIEKTVRLNIVGINKEQFKELYSWNEQISERIVFWGRVDHNKVIELTKASNWTIVLRDNNFVVNAGFPTKLVESISCGTPVIVNRFSNIDDYVNDDNAIVLDLPSDIQKGIRISKNKSVDVVSNRFDYHYFLKELEKIMSF